MANKARNNGDAQNSEDPSTEKFEIPRVEFEALVIDSAVAPVIKWLESDPEKKPDSKMKLDIGAQDAVRDCISHQARVEVERKLESLKTTQTFKDAPTNETANSSQKYPEVQTTDFSAAANIQLSTEDLDGVMSRIDMTLARNDEYLDIRMNDQDITDFRDKCLRRAIEGLANRKFDELHAKLRGAQ